MIEAAIKMIAFKIVPYLKDKLNSFDTLVLVISVLELILDRGNAGSLSALRAFRLFRLLKVARSWENLRIILDSIG